MQTHAQEGEEVVSANEVNTDLEDKQISLPPKRIERHRGRHESRPRKRRRTHEVAVYEERVRWATPIKLKSPNSRARSKMKARQLIQEADSSTESMADASQGRSTPEAGVELNRMREKEALVEKDLRTSAVSPTPIMSSRATRKEKGKAIMTEEVPPGGDKVPSVGIRMKAPLERPVLAVSSDTEEDPVALEKVAERVVEDVVGEAFAPQKVVSPRTSIRTVILEPGENPSAEETQSLRAKVAALPQLQQRKSKQETHAKYEVFQKRLAEEVKKRRYSEKTCEGLREDIENAKCAIVDLQNRLEASRTANNVELQRVDELTTVLEKKE
ncbi:hypothetical protein AXG93_269s1030 [Marchantia polymorpha subsp. ruderalis]|uniref:Uncharacterized protein n=1 Tax=Marchantia polymorpha subsp. ruderalis TaxID=1480154 RepID=A0A176W0H6_MARPO|nr:hypothetical protein AXG93_269s1030 [Marchantia polymorpha subsp. ruderalis]